MTSPSIGAVSKKNAPPRAFLALSAGVVAISFAAIFIRWADAHPLAIATWRMTLASVLLMPLAWRQRTAFAALSRRDFLLATVAGAFLALHFGLWISSLSLTSVASSVVLATSTSIWVGIYAHFMGRDRLRGRMVLGMAIALGGGVVIALSSQGGGSSRLLGNGLALGGAIMMAFFLTIGRDLRPRLPLWPFLFITVLPAAILLWLACLVGGVQTSGFSPTTWLMFLLLALVPQLIGHTALIWALRFVSATMVAVTVLGEPVGSTLLAFLLLQEAPGSVEMAGGVMILVGIFFASSAEKAANG